MPDPATDPHLPPSMGRYVPIDILGMGGVGVVYRARDPKIDRLVALKVVRADTLGTPGEARLLREAQAMAQVSHPNVITVLDVTSGRPRSSWQWSSPEHRDGEGTGDCLTRAGIVLGTPACTAPEQAGCLDAPLSWVQAERQDVVAQLDATEAPLAAELAPRVTEGLYRYAEQWRDAAGECPIELAGALDLLGKTRAELGETEAALAAHQRALALRREHLGDHRDVMHSQRRVADLLAACGDDEAALPLYDEALRYAEAHDEITARSTSTSARR